MDPKSLYVQLGRLVESVPDLTSSGAYPHATLQWLGRASALVSVLGDPMEISALRAASDQASSNSKPFAIDNKNRVLAAERVRLILYRALATAELEAPISAQGTFIPAGNSFDAFAAVGRVLGASKRDILIVDPYMDEKTLTDFAPLVPQSVSIRLLADKQDHKESLAPATRRWTEQYDKTRPLEVRLAPSRALHDRLIIVDDSDVSILTQSLNAFAARSPASIVRVDAETAALKVAAYQDAWKAAIKL